MLDPCQQCFDIKSNYNAQFQSCGNSASRKTLGLTLACCHGGRSLETTLHSRNAPPNAAHSGSMISNTILLLQLYTLRSRPRRFGGSGPALLCNPRRELYFLEKSVAFRGEFPQSILKILVAEP
jgi:hypothetical protein